LSTARDHYKVLQIDVNADPEVITAAFRALAKQLHPDRAATTRDDARMAALNQAYAVLRDPAQRRIYDAERALRATAPGRRAGAAKAKEVQAHAVGEETNGSRMPTRLDFGKHAGATLQEIADTDRAYLEWLSQHSSGIRFRREIAAILKGD
jgi:curved DNA-binding protein CbpA